MGMCDVFEILSNCENQEQNGSNNQKCILPIIYYSIMDIYLCCDPNLFWFLFSRHSNLK